MLSAAKSSMLWVMCLTKYVALSGVDGSGKSTIAYMLSMGSPNIKVVWFRWRAFTLYALYLYSKLRGLCVKVYVPRIKRWLYVHVFHVDGIARHLYLYLLFIDLTVFYLLYKLIIIVKGVEIVLFDRFYLDALVDAIHTCRRVDRVFLKLFIAMQRKVSKALVLDIDVSNAIARKKDIISLRELEFKRRVYLILAKHLNIPIIDARRDLTAVLNDSCRILQLRC